MKDHTEMPKEVFDTIYSDGKTLHEVALAHKCCDKNLVKVGYCAMIYPKRYLVTVEQVQEAKRELQEAKSRVFKEHKQDLLFVGMGMPFEPNAENYFSDVGNHRIRTQFLNSDGHEYFVEFGLGLRGQMRVDFSIDIELKEFYNDDYEHQGEFYNFMGLERKSGKVGEYSKQNILDLVNTIFGCNFNKVVVDNYVIYPDDQRVICESPKVER